MIIIALIIGLGALWDGFTTLFGIDEILGVFSAREVNPIKATFAVVVSLVVFGFMMATHWIWTFTADDLITLLLKVAWFLCFGIDLYTSVRGNSYYVFDNNVDTSAEVLGLILVTFLITTSTILMSRLLLAKDARGNKYLF
ncbi:MAG: hypothetical protein NW215_04800 [Hyphomicrobiales bacterium]|nr:hypothetical protein [Hyphomicrobiales bacterium]